MPVISIRKVDEETYKQLRMRAAEHGISMEEEARRILRHAVKAPERLGDLMLHYFGPEHGADLELPVHELHEPIKFGK